MVVKSSLDQAHGREEYILNDIEEPAGFDIASEYFKPSAYTLSHFLSAVARGAGLTDRNGETAMQGTVGAGGELSRGEVAESIEFCARVIKKVVKIINGDDIMLKVSRLNRVASFSEAFPTDVIDGMAPNMGRGELGLVPVAVRN
ncbi:hypothetical protein BDV10DRAFT_182043 [Aspergillus recurvatus]